MKRLAQICWVCSVHFLFYLAVPRLRTKNRGERVRLALEKLGLTFVKGGQILAALQLCGPQIQTELEKLWDRAQPLPLETILTIVKRELGERSSEMFSTFEIEPLACASIAQVHGAVLPDGREVVVKVLRPRVTEHVAQDIRLLAGIISFLSLFSVRVRSLRSARIPEHILRWLGQETDFYHEAHNIADFAEEYRGSQIISPEVVFASKELLVMTRLEGVSFNNWDESMRTQGLDPQSSIQSLLHEIFLPLFVHERSVLFHGDPHPANLFVLPEGKIGVVDLGLIGRASKDEVKLMNDVIFAVYEEDSEKVLKMLLRLCNNYRFKNSRAEERFRADVEVYTAQAASKPFTFWVVGVAQLLVTHGIPAPEFFLLEGRFGILVDRCVQDFLPGTSTPELLGTYMGMGVGKRLVMSFVKDLTKGVGKLPLVIAAVLRDPIGLAKDIFKELSPIF